MASLIFDKYKDVFCFYIEYATHNSMTGSTVFKTITPKISFCSAGELAR